MVNLLDCVSSGPGSVELIQRDQAGSWSRLSEPTFFHLRKLEMKVPVRLRALKTEAAAVFVLNFNSSLVILACFQFGPKL